MLTEIPSNTHSYDVTALELKEATVNPFPHSPLANIATAG